MAITKITNPNLFDLSTVNTALRLPNGGTATRPASPSQGEWRFNTDLKYVEFYDGGDWRQIDTEVTCTTNTVDYPTTNAAYYKLDSSAADQTTNNKDGAATDVTFYNGQQYSQGAVFNGSSSKIDLADNIIGAGTSSSSASIWFKSSSGNAAGDGETIIDAYNNSSAGWTILMEPAGGGLPDGNLYLANYTLGGTSGGTSVGYRDGNWHHLVVVFDHTAQTLKAYVDGNSTPVLSQVATVSPTNIFTTKSTIGSQNANPALPRYFNGVLDQCRIFAVALTTDQITELYNEVQCPCTTDDNNNPTTNVAYYKLDGNANDATTTYNLTWSGTEAYAYGPYGVAALLNGTNSGLTTSDSIVDNTKPTSISFWYNGNGNAGTQYIVGAGVGSTNNGPSVYFFNQGFGAIIVDSGSNVGSATGANTYSTTEWHHVVFTWDGSTTTNAFKVYVNGALEVEGTSTSSAATIGSYSSFGIGKLDAGGASPTYAAGIVDQVRIFDVELSATQVTSLYDEVYCNTVSKLDIFNEGTSSCLALYEFEDNANSTESSSYNGTWFGTEAYGGGQYKKAGIFNGSSSYINIPSAIYSSITGPFTLSAWINTTISGSYQMIMAMGGVSGVAAKGLSMWMDSSNKLYAQWGNGTTEDYWSVSATTSLNTGDWFHVAITVDGLTNPVVKGYVNGAAEGSGTTGSDSITFDTSLTIGARDDGGTISNYWNGSIDQVRIFNKELTATEVLQVYTE